MVNIRLSVSSDSDLMNVPTNLSLNSGLRLFFLTLVFLLVLRFLSGSRINEMYVSGGSLEKDGKFLCKNTELRMKKNLRTIASNKALFQP